MRKLILGQQSLVDVIHVAQRVRIGQMAGLLEPLSMRRFALKVPVGGYELQCLLKPKTEAIGALDANQLKWVELASKPVGNVEMPQLPSELAGTLDDEKLAPEAMMTDLLRHKYKDAGVRLVYTAVRFEAYCGKNGLYPPNLLAFAAPDITIYPFSGQPLIYRPGGAGYVL